MNSTHLFANPGSINEIICDNNKKDRQIYHCECDKRFAIGIATAWDDGNFDNSIWFSKHNHIDKIEEQYHDFCHRGNTEWSFLKLFVRFDVMGKTTFSDRKSTFRQEMTISDRK